MGIVDIEDAEKILNELLPGFDFKEGFNIVRIDELRKLVSININNEIYKIWSVDYIKPILIDFLKSKFKNCLISQEINDIDFVVIDNDNNDIIPIELQRTIFDNKSKGTFQNAQFEKSIRIQIDDNIRSSGKCWFFFDAEYLRYFQNGVLSKLISIDMNWFIEYMIKEKLKVFVIRYDEYVKELSIKDFDFLKQIHSDDEIFLDKNKLKIYRNVMNGYNFTQSEIDEFYEEYDNLLIKDKSGTKSRDLLSKSKNEKSVLYVNILRALSTLPGINELMDLKMIERRRLFEAKTLGLIDLVSSYRNRSVSKFVDKFDIAKYFPGYIRNEEAWNVFKHRNLSNVELNCLCRNNLKSKNQPCVDDF